MTGTADVVFVWIVHSATSAVLAVFGDGRSGDPLHERDDVNEFMSLRPRKMFI